ncbi:hypothetical protein ANTHELSMS3_02858 [Antarctobacter heliothermus]|uniref:Uncharacterized protein n=1 Tax=Antarctobacter heliothermus TaxID=74033 RepID=A0A222E5S6_9RHOB|nr:hypothetical protein ANTHELSMS3_02858 [Antarctobacter heliothermus]
MPSPQSYQYYYSQGTSDPANPADAVFLSVRRLPSKTLSRTPKTQAWMTRPLSAVHWIGQQQVFRRLSMGTQTRAIQYFK